MNTFDWILTLKGVDIKFSRLRWSRLFRLNISTVPELFCKRFVLNKLPIINRLCYLTDITVIDVSVSFTVINLLLQCKLESHSQRAALFYPITNALYLSIILRVQVCWHEFFWQGFCGCGFEERGCGCTDWSCLIVASFCRRPMGIFNTFLE